MASENETVAEVREDVHEYLTSIGPGEYPDETQFEEFADRFEAAHKREIAELREENARLRAALKPVLECKVLSAMTAEVEPGRSEYCATIIQKVQHIYNDGEAKKKKGDAK